MEEWEDMLGNKNISTIDPDMIWMHCEGEKGKINLTVDEYTPNVSWESLNLELVMFLRSHRLSMKVSKIIWKKLLLKMER